MIKCWRWKRSMCDATSGDFVSIHSLTYNPTSFENMLIDLLQTATHCEPLNLNGLWLIISFVTTLGWTCLMYGMQVPHWIGFVRAGMLQTPTPSRCIRKVWGMDSLMICFNSIHRQVLKLLLLFIWTIERQGWMLWRCFRYTETDVSFPKSVVGFIQCIHGCSGGTETGLPLEFTMVDKRSAWDRFPSKLLDYHLFGFCRAWFPSIHWELRRENVNWEHLRSHVVKVESEMSVRMASLGAASGKIEVLSCATRRTSRRSDGRPLSGRCWDGLKVRIEWMRKW
jgi:hypothetical protein